MKIIITGRPHIPVIKELRCSTEISLDSGDISKDICRYIVDKVSELSVNRGSTALGQEMQDALVKGANGMFL
jgi:hypothetical protein